MARAFSDLQNGVVLAELGGHGDGPYCARHGAGAALVMLGTYIVDPGDAVPYPKHFVFKPGRRSYAAYLKEHVAAARASGAKVAVSAISVKLGDTVDFLQAAEEAGADYASLCAYSVMEMFVSHGLGAELCRRKNQARLKEWAGALARGVKIPVIFKIGLTSVKETSSAMEIMQAAGVPIVHVCIGNSAPDSPGLRALAELKLKCDFLIAGGGIRDADGAKRVLNSGAAAVAIASAAMKDAALCGRIQAALRY